MSQESKQIQEQAQVQSLQLSPQQILLVRLIELPTVEMEERVRGEIQENPALEEDNSEKNGEEFEGNDSFDEGGNNTDYDANDDYRSEDDVPDYKLQDQNRSRGEQAEEIPFSDATSFYEVLKEQLSERELSDERRRVCEYIIGSLDDDGLLRKPLTALTDELAIYQGISITEKEVEECLQVIQDFEPAGLGARSLQECLLLQLYRKRETEASELLDLQIKILENCYEDFTRKHWDRIARQMGIDEQTCDKAIKEITRLNPRPGISLGESIGKNMQQIVPDFIVDVDENNRLSMTLNSGDIPSLKVNGDFRQMLDEQSQGKGVTNDRRDAAVFLKQKIDAAQMFIDAVRKRQDTLQRTMNAIMEMQRDFFIEGDETLLRPMILKDIATRTELDISTISRVCSNKYVQTHYGIFPLKFFFTDGFKNEDGEERSVKEIHRILLDSVASEDKKNPLTDAELCKILQDKGFPIARRTIAKYRDQLHIPVSRLRK